MDGAIILDKAEGITSHSAVVQVRRLLAEPRIGHLGTLDPFATGVLVLLVGKATRLARFYQDREKAYEGVIRFGYSTDTYDRTGTPTSPVQTVALDAEQIRRAMQGFVGTYLQQPPAVSAKKIGGARAYELARKGQHPLIEAVPVTIHQFEVLSIEGSCVCFRARVSSGTYIRSLAHELGERIGCGAHLAELQRTAVGEFQRSAAVTFERLQEMCQHGAPVIPMQDLLPEFPALKVPPAAVQAVSRGNLVTLECSVKWIKLLDDGGLAAIAENVGNSDYHPVVVFNSDNSS